MILLLIYIIGINTSVAATTLPYTTRTRDFSGWTPASRGDITTIGMSGATVASPSSISAAEVNSAGLAMTSASLSAQINSVRINDERIQKNGEGITSKQVGLALAPNPWGFGFAYYSPMREGGTYSFSNTNRALTTEVGLEEYRFILAHTYFQSRLSVGGSFRIIHATREIGAVDYNKTGISYNLGVLYRLEDRIILGASYSPSISIESGEDNPTQIDMPGFNRAVKMPSQLAVGVSWIPNRFFKAGFGLHRTGTTENTALLADETKITGSQVTVEPRLGANYVFADFKNINANFALGGYYETSRILGEADRMHATIGLEVNPYIFFSGIGFDLSKDYRNFMVFVGLNVIGTLRTFEIIPKDPVPPANQFFPEPFKAVPDGLPEGLIKGEQTTFKQPSMGDVTKIVTDIPKKISEKMNNSKSKNEKK